MPKIEKVSENVKTAIRRKSAYGLPDRPSEYGMKPEDIKRAFYQPIIDMSYSAITEIDRVADEVNTALEEVGAGMEKTNEAIKEAAKTAAEETAAHADKRDNPHKVTKEQVGLGKAENTSDEEKPVSKAQRQALTEHDSDAMAHALIRKAVEDGLAAKVSYDDINDTFVSSDVRKPLSANRGKLLYESLRETIEKADSSINDISLNASDGIMTITRTDGTSFTIDLPLEFLVKAGRYNGTSQEIELELENGDVLTIPVAALVNEYYDDGTTLTGYLDTDGKLKFKISDAYKKSIDANAAARHTHDNKGILDQTTAIFTEALKAIYDEYANKIALNQGAIETEAKTRKEQLKEKANQKFVEDELAKIKPDTDYYATNASVDEKITAAVNALVEDAPDTYNTFKELADYIASDKSAAEKMLADIETLKTNMSNYYKKTETYSRTETDNKIDTAIENAITKVLNTPV